jgi:hypothetical protein
VLSALRTILLDWKLNRATKGLVIFLVLRLTDEVLTGIGAAVVLAIVLDTVVPVQQLREIQLVGSVEIRLIKD